MSSGKFHLLACASVLAYACAPQIAAAQDTPDAAGTTATPQSSAPDAGAPAAQGDNFGDIVVTAQKREQNLNDVGLTIQAAGADTLAARGISSPNDLSKLVPGFSYTESLYSTPVFTLRGVGLFDATFGASPAVAVYTDQIPRNVPVMSQALDLDVERVEVLKGPQGTLFGQSSTGGAINYVTAKPTDELAAGVDVSYERFDKIEASGFISGPLSDTLKARLAVRGVTGGAWQYSLSRPNDKNGDTRKLMGRLTLDWQPTDRFHIEMSATGVRDKSDVQAPQFAGSVFNVYSAAALAAANANPATANPFGFVNEARYAALTNPASPGFDATFLGRQDTLARRLNGADSLNATYPGAQAGALALLGTPLTPNSSRAAEWTSGLLGPSDNYYYQGTLRADYDLSDEITLTSVTAYAKQKLEYAQDVDGTAARGIDVPIQGDVKSFNQEIRLAGNMESINWIVGATYDNVKTNQNNTFILFDYSGNAPIPGIPIEVTTNIYSSKMKSYAGFGNIEYEITENLTASAGVRYTDTTQGASYCYNDRSPNQNTAKVFSIFEGAFGNPGQPPIQPGECFVLGDGLQGTTFGLATRTPIVRSFSENNWSYRFGLNYKFDQGALLYATVSQGYKGGIYSAIGASSSSQYSEAVQEKVIAFEAGFKAPLADRRINLNVAGFYYDYTNKQVRGRILDSIFGLLEKLINVPKSYIYGIEGEILVRPIDGLNFSASATYLKAQVDGTFSVNPDGTKVYNAQGYTGDFDGSTLPFTPKFSANADVQYEWAMGENLRPFVGGTFLYQGSQNTTFKNDVLLADEFEIDSYETVDVRVGVGSQDDRWKLTAFGRNIFGKVYTTSINTLLDTRFRYTGRPATYGLSLKLRI